MRLSYLKFLSITIAIVGTSCEAQAQIYYDPSQTRTVVPLQQRVIVGTPNRVYSNNGAQYQSYRPTYGQPRAYSNNGYYVHPSPTYRQYAPHYNGQRSTRYYNPSTQTYYYGAPVYSTQPSTVYGGNYGTGFYSTPQQAANANVGASIGGAIGGSQGAQVGATIGATIKP